ncbi:hypothetical protein SAV14893_093260 [Streptomyces avermitilis]|uniref:Uncharacterized protein n=1 Tax=Streptomyces avermitilis TaxID=33903 RepID=A0A4D4MDF6_STRAX|nr:hypothetical protein SAV14893_093260 [Streptomyces avermitilis]
MNCGSAFDAVTDGQDRQAQEDGFGHAGRHFDVGASSGQVLSGGAKDHRVERAGQCLLEALAGEPVPGGVLGISLVDLESDLAIAGGTVPVATCFGESFGSPKPISSTMVTSMAAASQPKAREARRP